jgi:hypothetical protein
VAKGVVSEAVVGLGLVEEYKLIVIVLPLGILVWENKTPSNKIPVEIKGIAIGLLKIPKAFVPGNRYDISPEPPPPRNSPVTAKKNVAGSVFNPKPFASAL